MRYMLLIYLDEAKFAVMPQSRRDAYVNAMLDYDAALAEGGHLVMSEALRAPTEAVTVRRWEGEMAVTDGPFAETKEHLSGVIQINARDMTEAIRLAAQMPLADTGSIEVRPMETLERVPE
jgi:hypothetical protein